VVAASVGAVGGSEIKHPLFARFFDRLSGVMEPDLGPRRDELLAGLSGRVLEVGAGNGINFGHYPTSVQEVVAVEPEGYLRAKAEHAALTAPVSVTVQSGVVESLPFPDASFDAAVACLMLCSVSEQASALAELRRVLRPGGDLRFLEHVRSPKPGKARVQTLVDGAGIWPALGGGCHCGRDTVAAIESAGFVLQRVDSHDLGPSWMLTNPHVLGVAAAR
jgi:ubiquinone/menaquinone biosynthesis C-methylase UbiE